ncbi:MAG: hypothetical protein AAF490_27830 [Chloroflexota bacterium]
MSEPMVVRLDFQAMSNQQWADLITLQNKLRLEQEPEAVLPSFDEQQKTLPIFLTSLTKSSST